MPPIMHDECAGIFGAMAESVRIEAMTLATLRGDPEAFWSRFDDPYGLARMTPQKRRAMLANPAAGEDAQVVQLLAVKGDVGGGARWRVIGRLDMVRQELEVGGQRIAALWGSDWSVPEQERGSMAALTLLMQMQRLTPARGVIGASGPSQQAVEVYQKLKWVDLALTRLILLRRSKSVVERYVRSEMSRFVLEIKADVALATLGMWVDMATGSAAKGLRARVVDRFPREWEALLKPEQGTAGGVRSAAFLDWWMRESFFPLEGGRARNRNMLVLVETKRGEPAGYAACKLRHYDFATHRRLPNLLLGSIQDWAVFTDGAGRARASWLALFLLATRELGRAGADAIELCVDASQGEGAHAARALRRLGFLRVGEQHFLWKPAKDSPLADPRYAQRENWTLRPGDGDTFFT